MIDVRAQLIGSTAVNRLVDFDLKSLPGTGGVMADFYTGTVKGTFANITALHQVLLQDEFQLHQNEPFGPPGGRQLFYVQDCTRKKLDRFICDGILVRIKSHGNAAPPRQGQPHMSISLYTGGLGWKQEQMKFDVYGHATPKAPPKHLSPAEKDVWAHACHFNFPAGFDFTGAANLCPGNYLLRDQLWKAFHP